MILAAIPGVKRRRVHVTFFSFFHALKCFHATRRRTAGLGLRRSHRRPSCTLVAEAPSCQQCPRFRLEPRSEAPQVEAVKAAKSQHVEAEARCSLPRSKHSCWLHRCQETGEGLVLQDSLGSLKRILELCATPCGIQPNFSVEPLATLRASLANKACLIALPTSTAIPYCLVRQRRSLRSSVSKSRALSPFGFFRARSKT